MLRKTSVDALADHRQLSKTIYLLRQILLMDGTIFKCLSSQVIDQKQIFLHNQQQTNVCMLGDTEKQYTSWDNYNGKLMKI